LFGTPAQLRDCYVDVRLGVFSQEANPLTASAFFYAVPWTVAGTICVVPLERFGSVPEETPLIMNDTEGENAFNDLKFCPYDDRLLGAACQDNCARFWRIPAGGLTQNITSSDAILKGHNKRLLLLDFHPLASTITLTSGADNEVKLWDLENPGSPVVELPNVHKGMVTSVSWSHDGGLFATACKDKNLRLFDARSNKVTGETASHQGAKSGKVCFLGSKGLLATVGFSKTSERELVLHDVRNLQSKLTTLKIDTATSTPLPFFDEDNSIFYLTGKGDGTIKYYEIFDSDPYLFTLSEFKSKDPATGVAKLPKAACNVMKCEVAKFIKLTPTGQVIPIRFEVPRQNMDFFQEDLYPNTWDRKPSMSGSEWLKGTNKPGNTISMKP
jgi:coronin-1B/1C/6